MTSKLRRIRTHLQNRLTCPHCWHRYAPEDSLWVAAHPDLQHDPQLGEAALRFLPSRFSVQGNAIDSRGMECMDIACPHCHLLIPRPLLEMSPLFISIAGTPSCGKTYFLASMTWSLRHSMPKYFSMAFTDVDPSSNLVLNEYENQQFFNDDPDQIVKLAKTEEHGHLYDAVQYDDQVVNYPSPFLFSVRPSEVHPNYQNARRIGKILCLYDNAGESFDPGKDQVSSPVTQHLGRANVLMFCFDPTQDPQVREQVRAKADGSFHIPDLETRRQEVVLQEMFHRVRRHAGLDVHHRTDRPVIVIVTKFDLWWPIYGEETLAPPWIQSKHSDLWAVDLDRVDEVSRRVREVLWEHTPDLVATAESFSSRVLFIPVSATGCSPEIDSETGAILGMRPANIKPMWADVPLLTTLARWGSGMISYKRRRNSAATSGREQTKRQSKHDDAPPKPPPRNRS